MASDPRGTVLVVEDDPALGELLVELLAEEGYAVLQARDGREGLSVARERGPDLVLLDGILPGLSGLELLGELRAGERTRRIPVVLVSGLLPRPEDGGLQPDGVLLKPFEIDALLEHVGRAIARPGALGPA